MLVLFSLGRSNKHPCTGKVLRPPAFSDTKSSMSKSPGGGDMPWSGMTGAGIRVPPFQVQILTPPPTPSSPAHQHYCCGHSSVVSPALSRRTSCSDARYPTVALSNVIATRYMCLWSTWNMPRVTEEKSQLYLIWKDLHLNRAMQIQETPHSSIPQCAPFIPKLVPEPWGRLVLTALGFSQRRNLVRIKWEPARKTPDARSVLNYFLEDRIWVFLALRLFCVIGSKI